ncbi:hypothetical protein [Fuerstiella marisgermanici]|uniref:Uncharacterized protein n=1 Tax=Fuerstiella marisgermanici TaxID=1891926 RepID=A0A1P8WKG6_9PLAN|nr:hypothetical protein [Fuerstiella marisgermanici]APZ94547.1 hypothetical protein Fuma_04179 [Fuerstiella marisgermanici]
MNDNIKQRLRGRVRIAKMRLSRARRTRNGLATSQRRVAGEFPGGDIACSRSRQSVGSALAAEELADELRRLIRRFTRNVRWTWLLERRLIFDDQIKRLAAEIGVPNQSARRKVMQARRFVEANLADSFLDDWCRTPA